MFSFTTRYVLVIGLLLLAANVMLGLVDLRRSSATIKGLINRNMLDLANTAASLVDGDALSAMTEADVGTEPYDNILKDLTAFQNNADIHFIYAVRKVGEEEFVFLVDADPDEPAAFGEEVVVSSGLVRAGEGVAAVDDAPLADRWGNYYSAYSPVFDSAGRLSGVIGVDFDADWYDDQVRNSTLYITYTSIISVALGGVLVFLITRRVRRKFLDIHRGISALSDTVDELTREIGVMSGRASAPTGEEDESADELEALGARVQAMQNDMMLYLEYLKDRAYIDPLTQVGSAAAYHDRIHALEDRIAAGDARFYVAVFDINNLKQINDSLGHECGDLIISGLGEALSEVYGRDSAYRIGGDEFAVVQEDVDEALAAQRLSALDAAVEAFNARNRESRVALAVSKDGTFYRPGQDEAFKDVFARADQLMYAQKKRYYETHDDRRGKKPYRA